MNKHTDKILGVFLLWCVMGFCCVVFLPYFWVRDLWLKFKEWTYD